LKSYSNGAEVCAGQYGVNEIIYEIQTYYQPWFFNGSVVLWGNSWPSREAAEKQAIEIMSHN
jgi:hypothetical protein